MSSDSDDIPTPVTTEVATEEPCKLAPNEVNFGFGPQDWYFAHFNGAWRFVRSQQSDWSNLRMYKAFWVAFKHDTGFIIGGEDEDGDGRVVHTWNDGHMIRFDKVDSFVTTRDAYQKLFDWITSETASDSKKVEEVSAAIGPKGSYFARCGKEHISHALPKDLESAIQKSDSPPHTIALGIKGSWIVLWCDGTRSWDLRFAYPTLSTSECLKDDSNKVSFVALNPYKEDKYFIVAENGSCTYSISHNDTQEPGKLRVMMENYMNMRAKRDGVSYEHVRTLNGEKQTIHIAGPSNQQSSHADRLLATLRSRTSLTTRRDAAFILALTGGTGTIARLAGIPMLRAVGLATGVGFGATMSTLYNTAV